MNFNDMVAYNHEMSKSWYDKIGFIDKIFEPIDVVVDFGCADGAVTRFIKSFFNGKLVIGYDLPEVLEANGLEGEVDDFGVMYLSDWKDVMKRVESRGKSLLVMNSVLHEIFNYMQPNEISELFGNLFNGSFNYIWIRDMYISDPVMDTNRTVEFDNAINKIKATDGLNKRFTDFVYVSGVPDRWYGLMHFLMKCRFERNWDREVHEDYTDFRENWEYLKNILNNKYEATFKDIYLLPYIQYINKKELAVDLDALGIRTHFRAVYKLKD